ncbi:MAG: GAF domain-containing protein, partial [Anaerolineae bacterium]|nr:GAF domain-containing protein [Anaerolineae bacterium]
RILIADQSGLVLYDTNNPDLDVLGTLGQEHFVQLTDLYPDAAQVFAPGAPSLNVQTIDDRIVSSGRTTFGLGGDVYWTVALVDDAGQVAGAGNVLSLAAVVGSLLIGALITLAVGLIMRRMLRPIGSVSALVDRWREGAVEAPAQVVSDDEVGQLMQVFQSLSSRVETLRTELETQQGRYTRNMDIAARVSRETATLHDFDQLLNRSLDLICQEFGFYHAQVFLIDDIGENAVLVFSHGDIGEQLLKAGHKIPVGSESVIGSVTATGKAVVVNDTTNESGSPHQYNPLLPQTRAEIALPLSLGDRTIGALDVQSMHADSFHDDELRTFQILADQIAVAIQNVRLLTQSEQRITQIDALNRQLTRMAWEETSQRSNLETVYHYDLLQLDEGVVVDQPALSLPIAIRGEVVGSLDAAPPEGTFFTDGDHAIMRAVADRVAIAIENARLFEETQSSLAETFTLYQLSRYLNEADSLEAILQAIIVSVMPDASSGQMGVFADYTKTPETLRMVEDWSLQDTGRERLAGMQLRVADHPLLAEMLPSRVALVTDTARDTRIDEAFRAIVDNTGAQSMVFIPFSVRGVWRGVIVIEFPTRRDFSEREGRLYGALIDQAGVAIDNRMLLRQNELALAEIERLYEASRIINMAQNMSDLVRAAVNVTDDPTLDFELGIFEGTLDVTGWPTHIRVVARSRGGEVVNIEEAKPVIIDADSPLRTHEPRRIIDADPDMPSERGVVQYMRKHGFRSMVTLPLFSANQPIALFSITSPEPRDLSPEDYDIFYALAGQMSTVLQNRRLLEQTELALDETRRLYAASRSITAAADSAAVYQSAAIHLATAATAVQRVSILLAQPTPTPDAPYLEYAYIWTRGGSSDLQTGSRIPRDRIAFPDLLNNDGTAVIPDVRRDLTAFGALQEILERSGTGSAVIAAVQSRLRWYGVVLCESLDTAAFPEGYINFMRAVADQVAVAVESLLSFEEAQMQALRALALAEAGQLASRMSREFAHSLEEVFSRVAQVANYDRWSLALVNEARTQLETVIERRSPEVESASETPAYLDLSSDSSPLVQAFNTRQTLLINDPSRFPDADWQTPNSANDFGKGVIIPVRLGDDMVGVLMVGRPLRAPDLDSSDEQLATTLAAQVAIAVENQRLLRAAENERERLSSILASLPAGVLVLDPATYKPVQYNDQIEQLLGRPVRVDQPFDVATYQILRSGTDTLYSADALPIFAASRTRALASSDDIAVLLDDGTEVDLLMNAVPILNDDGSVSAIVAAFQDISARRNLERTLETNLRETVALYETSRALAEAEEVEQVLEQLLEQLALQDVSDAFVLLLDEQSGVVRLARSLSGTVINPALGSDILDRRSPVYVADVRQAPELSETTRAMLLESGIIALASIPMRAGARRDDPLGWLVMTFAETQQFTPEREQFLNTLNDNAAVVLDNRYLLQRTEAALQDTAALYSVTTDLSRARTEEEISEAIRTALANLSPDIFAAYFVVEGELRALFNVSLDSAPVTFAEMIVSHQLMKQPNQFIDDVRAVAEPGSFEQDLRARGNIRSLALVHLRSQNLPFGCLFVAYHTPHTFTDGDIRYLNSVADSASVVIDNYLLLDQIQGSLEETSILYRASRALNDASTPSEILNVIISYLTNRPVSHGFIALLSTESWENPRAAAQVVATWQRDSDFGINLTGMTLVPGQYPAWRFVASSAVMMVDDISTADNLDAMERIGIESLELRSLSVLPLRIAGRAIGAMVFGSRVPYRHTERDLRIYSSLAEQASLRLEAARLLTQTERRARQLTTSAEVSQIASSILDLSILLPRIVDLIHDSFGYDHVQIFLMDDQNKFAELRASTGEAGRQLLEIRHKLERGSASVIGKVTASGQPTIASDTADATVVHRPNPYLPRTRSEMAIPFKLKGHVVGALDVQSNQPNAFDDDDIQVLTTLAAQISVAIDNAQLFEQARQRANEMSFLFDVTTAAASAETLQGAIQNVANELLHSLEALSASVYLPKLYVDAEDNEVTMLEPVALAGSNQPLSELSEVRLESPNNLIADAARMRRSIIIDNVHTKPDYLPVVTSARSAIIVPLVAGAQLVCLVALENNEFAAYGQDTLTLLLTLSGTLSAIIQNQQLLEQVQQTNEQLRELDRLKSDFLANMSHELRTPLNSIIGFSRVILKGIDGPLTEMQEQDLSTIYNSGQHLLNLINDILDQAKIAAGKMDLQFDHFEMKNAIDGARSIGIGLVKDKAIDIYTDIAPGIPKVWGDEFRTRQVLINLVSNAAKFTREGSITISAYPVRDEETEKMMIRVDVTDTGIGIDDKDMMLLFEAFRQVDSSLTRTQGGTGLGLPISKSLVEMQGGRMLVSSRVNVGSTFTILMPVEPPADAEEAPKKKTTDNLTLTPVKKRGVTGPLVMPTNGHPAPMLTEPPMAHTKRQILLIEDNPDMVDQYRRALQREGFDIFTASIPLEAEAMASGLHPTMLIMDVNFAGGQGWDILGRMKGRDDTADIPVIIITLSGERQRALDLGAFRFIERPFAPDDLVTAVQEAERESRIERILIIDDQPESVRLLTQVLDEQGMYRVFSAGTGAEGIALVARRRPNLVILDLRMPEMDGFKVLQELRGNPETATIPVLIVTGDSINEGEREQLANVSVLHKGEISAEEYRQLLDGVRANLGGV